MKISRSAVNFNRQMIFAESGSFVCTPLAAHIFSRFTSAPNYISFGAILGGIVGSSFMFVATRIRDKRKFDDKNYASRELIGDLAYITPAAFILAVIVYYPFVFYASRYLLLQDFRATVSALAGQLGAFILIAICLNIYRLILKKKFGKEL